MVHEHTYHLDVQDISVNVLLLKIFLCSLCYRSPSISVCSQRKDTCYTPHTVVIVANSFPTWFMNYLDLRYLISCIMQPACTTAMIKYYGNRNINVPVLGIFLELLLLHACFITHVAWAHMLIICLPTILTDHLHSYHSY